ncbi:transglycosylase family protein [Streptomyces sp. NPDC086766]|uniref:transglycosylase family protein n=1 Tax=Streptomyces sp. NPDC086766 TaxID=3365754 RepID=UPI0038036746
MLPGNGRHRRPRQAPAILVAAGVTGSAIALPLLGASGASAADGTTWDKVAECESGGSWSADNGNGYYGGLQLTQDDWEKYGGLSFAPSADQASRSQQISVAEKILADRGPGAWPTCGLLSGLTKDSGAANVDTGLGDALSGSSDSSDSPGSADSGLSNAAPGISHSSGSSGSSHGKSGSSGSSDESSETPSTSPSSPSLSGKKGESGKSDTSADAGASHDSSSSPSVSPEVDDPDNSAQIGGSSALVDTGSIGGGRHRGGSAAEGPADVRVDTSSGRHASRGDADARATVDDSYTVRAGDSLASIADSLAVDGGWRSLYAANKDAIGVDPNHIFAGQTLDLPTETTQK